MFTLYVPLYESDTRTVQSELATFFEAFPYATVWANTRGGQGYDMVFLGQAEPLKIDLDQIEQRLHLPSYAPVAGSLREIGIFSAINLLSVYTGQQADLGRWVKGAQINRDRDLRLQYLAGWGINSRMQDAIYRQMLLYRATCRSRRLLAPGNPCNRCGRPSHRPPAARNRLTARRSPFPGFRRTHPR